MDSPAFAGDVEVFLERAIVHESVLNYLRVRIPEIIIFPRKLTICKAESSESSESSEGRRLSKKRSSFMLE